MTDDIVARLRAVLHNDRSVELMNREAADEIERLRRRLLAEENAYDIERRQNEHLQTDRNNLELEVERLRKERDEASAEIKRLRQENATLTAERDALWRLTDRLTAEHDALRAERDEARREVCQLLASPESVMHLAKPGNGTKRDFAAEQGWDCFKEAGDEP